MPERTADARLIAGYRISGIERGESAMTPDELNDMPHNARLMKKKDFPAWIATRKEAGASINVETAEVWWSPEGDPYQLGSYAMQVEVLRRLRHGGCQYVRVEHVHIMRVGGLLSAM
jgi:hypothetical protein